MKKLVTAVLLLCAGRAFAGDPKFEYRDQEKPPDKPWVLKSNASFGLTWAAGNSQSLGFSGSAFFSAKHYNNQWETFGQGAYVSTGSSTFGTGGPINKTTTSTQLWLWRARYDRYFGERNTIYGTFQISGDKPSGYWYRIEPQVGYARLFLKSERQLFRGEGGYDYTFEHRVHNSDQIANVEYHSLRLFLYYENKFTKYAAVTEGLEMLWAMNDVESVRLNSLTSLSSTIYKNISLKLNFTVHFNNKPPPRTNLDPAQPDNITLDKVDTLLEAVLAVTFL
jgi:putative salt-induced outer membrane protein YdiY